MKIFLTLMLSTAVLMGVEPVHAEILTTTGVALRLLVSPMTMDERTFINNMQTTYNLLKNFEAEPGEESADYYPMVSILLEIKVLSKKVVDLSTVLSSPKHYAYDEALEILREEYNKAEKLWDQLERWINETPLAYFTGFIQNFGVKTAFAGDFMGFNGDPKVITKTLERIKKNREDDLEAICRLEGKIWSGEEGKCGKCCNDKDSDCLCESICGKLADDDVHCCPNKKDGTIDLDCFCKYSPTDPACLCRKEGFVSTADRGSKRYKLYQECQCKMRNSSPKYMFQPVSVFEGVRTDMVFWNWIPNESPEGGTCCKKGDKECECLAHYNKPLTGKEGKFICCPLSEYANKDFPPGHVFNDSVEFGVKFAKCRCDVEDENWDSVNLRCCPKGYVWIPEEGDSPIRPYIPCAKCVHDPSKPEDPSIFQKIKGFFDW